MKRVNAYLLRVSRELRLPYKGYIAKFPNTYLAKSLFVGSEGKSEKLDSLILSDELNLELVFSARSYLFDYTPNRAVIKNGKVIDRITGNAVCFKYDDSGNPIDITAEDVEFIESCLKPIKTFLCEFTESVDPAELPIYCVQETLSDCLTDFLQFVCNSAENYDAADGWAMSDLIELADKYCSKLKGEKHMENKNFYDSLFPTGTKLRLTAPIEDPYGPKAVGDILTVSYIDDALQIHGKWESGGSLAIIIGKDDFEIVNE